MKKVRDKIKTIKKSIKRLFKREFIIKVIVVISGSLLVLTSVLPYIIS